MTSPPASVAAAAPPKPLARPWARAARDEAARRALFLAAIAFCLTPWASPPIALALGVVLALLVPNPFRAATQKSSKLLLQACVVLLGFGMDLPVVLRAGASGMAFAAVSIAATLGLGYVLGRMLNVRRMASMLISVGTAICGGSAIAAAGATVDAADEDMTIALGTVFLLNAVALYLFPPLGRMIGLSDHQFGTWAGVAIHDVSSVVAAANAYDRHGHVALQIATAVKLARALWIVPLVLGIGWFARVHANNKACCMCGADRAAIAAEGRRTPRLPWFIALFLLASVARTFIPQVARLAPDLTHAAQVGLTLTLFLIGAGLTRRTLAAVGPKTLIQGVVLWAFISGLSLLAVLKFP